MELGSMTHTEIRQTWQSEALIELKKELKLIVVWLIENKNDEYLSRIINRETRVNIFIELLEYYYEMDINDIVKIKGEE